MVNLDGPVNIPLKQPEMPQMPPTEVAEDNETTEE